jgi:hypothetical protein
MSLKQFVAIVIIGLLISPIVCARESPERSHAQPPLVPQASSQKPLPEEQRKAQAEAERQAVLLLEELIGEAASLRLIEKRLPNSGSLHLSDFDLDCLRFHVVLTSSSIA